MFDTSKIYKTLHMFHLTMKLDGQNNTVSNNSCCCSYLFILIVQIKNLSYSVHVLLRYEII